MQSNSANSRADVANVTIVTDDRQIIVPHTITEVVEVNTPGPQGPIGPQGVAGPSVPFTNLGNNTYATTSSLQVSGSFLVSGSSTFTNIGPAIFSGSANIVGATTMSSALVSGNVTVLGTASINVLQINTTINSTGSNVLGDAINDIQTLYGSVIVPTGSLTVTGSVIISGSTPSLQLGSTSFVGDFTNPAITLGSTSNGIYLDSNRISFKAGGVFSGGFSSDGYLTNQIQIRGTLFNDLTTAMFIPYRLSTAGLSAGLGGDSSGSVVLITSGSSRLYVSSSGNVGIGTTAPAYALDVRTTSGFIVSAFKSQYLATGYIGTDNSAIWIGRGTDGFNSAFVAGSNLLLFRANNTQVGEFWSTGNFTIQTGGTYIDAGYKLDVKGSTRVQGAGTTSATTALRVENINTSSSLVVLDNGYVGINTGSAQYNLDVNGTSRLNGSAQISSINLGISNNSQLADASGVMDLKGYNGFTLKTWTAGWASGATALSIAANGYIGINTGSAQYNLDVSGSARIVNTRFDTSASIETITFSKGTIKSDTSGTNHFRIASNAGTSMFIDVGYSNLNINNGINAAGSISLGGTRGRLFLFGGGEDYIGCADGTGYNYSTRISAWSNIEFGPSSGIGQAGFVNRYIMTSTGLGINVPTPTARLHISGSTSDALLKLDTPTASNILYVSGSGNVGIGISTPTVALDVNGAIRSSNAFSNAVGMTLYTLSSRAQLYQAGGVDLAYYDSVTPAVVNGLSLRNTGNVLIGTTTDAGYKLDVSGSARTTGNIQANGFYTNAANGIGWFSPATAIRISTNDNGANIIANNTPYFSFANQGTSITRTSGTGKWFELASFVDFSPSSGTTTMDWLSIAPTINQTGGANGITRGIYINPTLTSAPSFRAIETTTGSVILNGGNVGIGTTSPDRKLHISSSTTTGLRVDVTGNGSDAILIGTPDALIRWSGGSYINKNAFYSATDDQQFITYDGANTQTRLQIKASNGNIGIGTTTPAYKLDVSGSTRINGTINMSGSLTNYNLIDYSGSAYGSTFKLRDWAWNLVNGVSLDTYNMYLNLTGELKVGGNYGLLQSTATTIGGGYPSLTTRLTVQGIGATSTTKTVNIKNSTPVDLLTILDNGQVAFTSPTMSLAASQSAFSISPIISASNIVGGQYYGVSITPTFFQTTGSQTETAFRVAATFTSSNATATSGSNIIADFGSTSAGSQLTVTDVTSGSIYMVNDVSGIPIIEATSNWDVNIYDFPNKIFEKTGSQVNIYGTMRVSGSFILPLSQSATPQTGSAYWSGSFLFIYDGTRYRSSSFA